MATTGNNGNYTPETANNTADKVTSIEQKSTIEEAKSGTENLKYLTINSSLSTASTKSDLTIEKTGLKYEKDIHTLVGFLSVLDELLEEIEDTKSGISKKGLSKAGKKTMDEAKTKLKQYESQLKGKKKTLLKQNRAEIYENDILNLKNIREEVNNVRADIGMGQWGNFSSTASYLYNSPETARQSNTHQTRNLEFNQNFQNELKEGAILRIFNGNIQKANDFFRRVAQGEYTQADYQLFISNAAVLSPCCQRYGISIPSNPNGSTGGRVEVAQGSPRRSVDYSNMDRGETFQQGGIAGIIDKALSNCNNLTPGQRNTWKSIAVLGGYAAGIFGLYKFFTNKKMGFWGKLLTSGGVIFGSQVLTGENPISLFQKLMTGGFSKDELENKFGNAFGDAVDGVHNSGIEGADNLSGAMYSMMVFNQSTKVGDVRQLASKFKNNRQEWAQFRGDALNKLNKYGKTRVESFRAAFSENFDENKRNEWLNSIGIHDGIDDNKLVYELAGNKTMNAIIINKFLSDNGVKVTDNKTKKEEFEQYIKSINDNNQAIDMATLENHKNDRFKIDGEATFTDRPEDIQNKEKLGNQIDQLSLTEPKKAELKKAMDLFYDERTIESKPNPNDFNLKIEGGLLILTSHSGHKSKIDLSKNEIVGFGNGITFTSLSDLLNTADLANKILESQKGKTPKDLPAFEYKMGKGGRGIYFNDADTLSFDFDTRVLSGGWGGKIEEINVLNNHQNEYADYLSKRRLEQNKINIDGALYPTVKKLSDSGIIFTNQQEVKDLEIWLKGIKEKLKVFKCHPDGNPFSIGGTLSKKLKFKTVNNNIEEFPENIPEKFPTLLRTGNEDKFLNFMNNPSNKMRGFV